VAFVMEGRKVYRFTVRWGEERDTDDAEGRITESSAERPTAAAVGALLPRFTGQITQAPPRFSAVKIAGERAYDLARDGEVVDIAPRPVEIHRLELIETPDPERAGLLPVEAGVAALPALRVSTGDAGRLARGQAVLLRGRDAPVIGGWVAVFSQGALIALAEVEKGEVRPRRIFNLPRG